MNNSTKFKKIANIPMPADGIFPIALWGKDGSVWAFAALTDLVYYDDKTPDEWREVRGW